MGNVTEVKNSVNNVQVVGKMKECNMKIETEETELTKGDTKKKVTCKVAKKVSFANPSFTIECNGNDIGVSFATIKEKKLDENGNIVKNPRFTAMETILNTYTFGGENATRVKYDGQLVVDEYYSVPSDKWVSKPSIGGFFSKLTSTNVPEEDISEGEISGVIINMAKEVNASEEETGRLKIDLLSFNNNEGTIRTFVVEADLADDVEEFYEVGQSVLFNYDIVSKQIGAKRTKTSGFGRKDSKMSTGFTITEYSIFKGDEPLDEDSKLYVDISVAKELLNARELKIERLTNEAKSNKDKPKEIPKANKKSPFGGSNEEPPFEENTAEAPKTSKKKNPFL